MPADGDRKMIGHVLFEYRGGVWVPIDGPHPTDDRRPEDLDQLRAPDPDES